MAMYYRGKEYDLANISSSLDHKVLNVLWKYAGPFRSMLILAVIVMIADTAVDLFRPYLLKVAIDGQIVTKDLAGLYQIAWLYGVTILVSSFLAYIETYLLQYVGQQIIYEVRQKVFRYLVYQSYTQLENQPVGRMVTRVTNDTDAIEDLFTDVAVATVHDFLVLLGIIIVMLILNWRLALMSFTVIPLMIIVAVGYQRYARRAYRLVREKTAQLNSFLQETMNGISVVKAFARFNRTVVEYQRFNRDYLAAGLKELRIFAVFRPLVDLVYTFAVVLVLWCGGWYSRDNGIEIGVIIAFLSYVEKFFWPIKDLAEKYGLLQSALAAAERVHHMLDSDRLPEEPEGNVSDLHLCGEIIFEDVWFAYEEPYWILEGLSFSVKAGSFIGIVGFSGAGKTTLISLLLRFYQPQRGRILLDGKDIHDIPIEVLRRRVGVVFQDVHMFNGTVADNIRMFNNNISQDKIISAANTANVHDFIESLPQGYATPIGYQGALISVGQRQLLSLARALAYGSEVLVLDEATSNIDGETELMIQNALEKVATERTMLVVAHRLSTIINANQIIVLHKGRVAEAGYHDELLALKGLYWRLFISQ
jgi:ATP-binding cassette subfamily B protein